MAKQLEIVRAIPAHAVIVVIGEIPIYPNYYVNMAPDGAIDISPNWFEDVTANIADLQQ